MNLASMAMRVWSRSHVLLALPIVLVSLVGCDASVAGTESSVDASLLRAEMVDQRLEVTSQLVDGVAKAAPVSAVDLSITKPLLKQAASKAFDADDMKAKILAAVSKTGGDYGDAKAFAKAASAISEGHKTIAKMYAEKDEALGEKLEARLAEPDTKSVITQLVTLMPSPDLAVEMAITQQAVVAALNANPDDAALNSDADARQKLASTLPSILSELRSKTENEGSYSKETAKLAEVTNLTYALATLSNEDLSALQNFYTSPSGKAKTQALNSGYRDVWHAANLRMLNNYFDTLAEHNKNNPKVQ